MSDKTLKRSTANKAHTSSMTIEGSYEIIIDVPTMKRKEKNKTDIQKSCTNFNWNGRTTSWRIHITTFPAS